MADVLREFLVAIGFVSDRNSERQLIDSAKRVETAVVGSDKAMTTAQASGAAARTEIANRERAVRTRGAAQVVAESKAKQKAIIEYTEVDAVQAKKRQDALNKDRDNQRHRSSEFVNFLGSMAAATVAATVAIASATVKIGGSMEQLYYSSKRVGASANNIKAFQYAAKQLGSSEEEASSTLEGFAEKLRSAPGAEQMMNAIGVRTRDRNGKMIELTEQFEQLGQRLRHHPDHFAKAWAAQMEVSPKLLIALRNPKFHEMRKEYDKVLESAGLDNDKSSEINQNFMQKWRKMGAAVETVVTKIQAAVVEKFGGSIDKLADWLATNSGRIADVFIKMGDVAARLAGRVATLFDKFKELSPGTQDFITKIAALGTALLLLRAGPIGALLALAGAIVTLYDDYRKWKDGDTDTLIDWEKWGPVLESTLTALKEMWGKFDDLAKRLTGTDGLTVALAAFGAVLALKVLSPLTRIVPLLTGLVGLNLPAWMLALLGIGTIGADKMTPNAEKPGLQKHWDDEAAGGPGVGEMASRAWRWAKRKLGFGGGATGDPGPAPAGLLDGIARAEGTAGRPDKGYNTSLGYGRFLPGGTEQDLTSKSLREILDLGTYMRQQPGNPNSSALGRYQIVGSTLKDAAAALNMDLDKTKFSAETQDRMAHWIARRQGLGAWEGFKGRPNERAAAQAALDRSDSKEVVGGVHPLDGAGKVSSEYGMRVHPIHKDLRPHNGIDIKAPAGTDVKSMTAGIVSIGSHGDITVKQGDGSSTTYRHVVPSVADGARVAAGQLIAQLKRYDPRSTGPHLHLEARDAKGNLMNPRGLLAPKPPAEAPQAAPGPAGGARSGWVSPPKKAPADSTIDLAPIDVPKSQNGSSSLKLPGTINRAIPKVERALQSFNDRFEGSLNAAGDVGRSFQGRPLGTMATNNNWSTVNNSVTGGATTINVNGAGDPKAVANEVKWAQKGIMADLQRNMRSAIG